MQRCSINWDGYLYTSQTPPHDAQKDLRVRRLMSVTVGTLHILSKAWVRGIDHTFCINWVFKASTKPRVIHWDQGG
jgi:hypothetical protein